MCQAFVTLPSLWQLMTTVSVYDYGPNDDIPLYFNGEGGGEEMFVV